MSRRVLLLVAMVAVAAMLPACRSSGAGAPSTQMATIVPDGPRLRGGVFRQDCVSGLVLLYVDCNRGNNSVSVPAGRVDMRVVFQDTQDTVPDRRLATNPVAFPLDVQCGRRYVIRGLRFHPPCSATNRPLDPAAYRVVFAAQDMTTGEIVKTVEVDAADNKWLDTGTDLLMDLFS